MRGLFEPVLYGVGGYQPDGFMDLVISRRFIGFKDWCVTC